MERLTEKHYRGNGYYMKCSEHCSREDIDCIYCSDSDKLVDRLGIYEDTGLTPEEVAEYKKFEDEAVSKGVPFSRIVELMNADKGGRLVVLPCKVGDTVYRLFCGSKVNPVISKVKINTLNDAVALIEKMGMHKYTGCFLTREEAEAALKEAKEDG